MATVIDALLTGEKTLQYEPRLYETVSFAILVSNIEQFTLVRDNRPRGCLKRL